MKVTQLLKSWLVANCGASEDASDEDFRKAAAEAMLKPEGDKGYLSHDKYLELTADPDASKASALEDKLDQIITGQSELGERINVLEERSQQPEPKAPETPEPTPQPEPTPTPEPKKERQPSALEKAFSQSSGSEVQIRQVDAVEQYDSTKTALRFPEQTDKGERHPLAGQVVTEGDKSTGMRAIDKPSEAEMAVCGAYWKFSIASQLRGRVPHQLRMTDHDRDLLWWGLHNMKWGGVIHGDCSSVEGSIAVKNRKLADHEIKALIDDSTSGGLEIAPIVFDDAIIETPYLTGELYPLVTVIPVTRGRRIEGASVSQVTLAASSEDTQISLFNTASFVAAFDTTIFVVAGAIEIGLDFISDAVPDIAGMVARQYGQKLLEWLDEQIAKGDGTTEPEGIVTASGTTTVNAANAATGPPTVGDYEGLLFGVDKKYKQGYQRNRIAYCATETSYQRARAIAVGTSDARRVFGMDHENYQLLGHPYKINDQLTNRQQFFGVMPRYRMYRRLGMTTKVTTEGDYLARRNLMLLVARARFGGQIEDGSAFAVISDGQS